ncbi:MAG: hypothetical protein HOW97_40805 [Catenulispora sp.]|nr:hypothetical protein [Catenulispora sp.]
MLAAGADARRSGKPVQVSSLTSPVQEVSAVPSGGFELSVTPEPVRTQVAGSWVPVDLTLHRGSGGRLSPAATAYGTVSFSGGGRDPLVTTRSGAVTMTVSWPGTLPVPVVDGATATYASVLPSVDLVVSATAGGGFTDTLVVKSQAAANDPALRTLHLGTKVDGGRLARSADGALSVRDAAGRDVMDAASPLMWDSNTALPPSTTARVAADASDHAHPGMAARVAPVSTTVSDAELSLSPDLRMLTSASSVLPIYIDPTFSWHPYNPAAPAFDEVKEGCPSTSFYNLTNSQGDYGQLGVGYNSWGGCTGREHALYQWSLSSTIWGAQINSATVNATEVYTAACSGTYTVNLHWSGGIGSGTDWNNRPAYNSYSTSASYARSYNATYCPSNGSVSHGLNVLTPIVSDAAGHASSFAVTLSEDSAESTKSGNGFSRFSHNPALQIFYNIIPQAPTASTMSAVSGADTVGCATSSPYPIMGKTVFTAPPVLTAKVSDADGDKLQATYQYWVDGTTTVYTGTSADNLASGTNATFSLPGTFISSLTNGQVVDWQVKVTDGEATTAYSSSPTCHFTVLTTAPDAPSVSSVNNAYPNTDQSGGVGAPAGTAGTFSLVSSGGSTAAKFVYNLDVAPATASPPASEVVTATNNAAQVTVTPYAPGPHTLWVYAVDAAGNDSSTYGYPFLAAGDPGSTCASLAACFNNTGISSDTAMAQADIDGQGDSFSATDLANAGWNSGGKVTVNGATFTLPAFGAGQKDNVLAANQTVGFSGSGNALEFLATATYAKFTTPGAIAGDTTAPSVPQGTLVSGSYCFSSSDPQAFCPATGTVNYSDGSSGTYDLTVPNWWFGSQFPAVSLPHRNDPAGQAASAHQLYAFSVPIDASKTIVSVTLPDVGNHVGNQAQSLHIFGMATRDTTAGTPQADGTTAAAPAGQTWTGDWADPLEGHYSLGSSAWSNMTVRVAVKPSLSGGTVRIKLDNGLGTSSSSKLSIGHVTIAPASGGGSPSAVPSGTPTTLTFGGAQAVTIPAGGMVYSDPISFPVTAGQYVLVSYQLANSVPYLVEHTFANDAYEYLSAVGAGDKTADTTGTPFSGTGTQQGWFTDLVTDLDVTTAHVPTQAVLGDGLIDPWESGTTTSAGALRIADILSAAEPTAPSAYGTIGEGIEANQILKDFGEATSGGSNGGASALARLDRDILSQPGIGNVLIDEGLEDLLHGATDANLEANGYTPLVQQLQAWGISTTLTSLTACDGYTGAGGGIDPCTAAVDGYRTSANAWLGGDNLGGPWSTPPVYFADFDAATAVPDTTNGEEKLSGKVDPGDHVNLTATGFGAEVTDILTPHDTWALNDGTGATTAADTAPNNTPFALTDPTVGSSPLTLTGTTWTSDATRGGVLAFDGSTGYAASSGPALNTAGSYSVSAWAKLSALPTANQTVAAQDGVQQSPFYLQYNWYNSNTPGWAMTFPASDTTSPPFAVAYSQGATANTWTHLVGTYNAATHTAQLYVNGALVATTGGVTSWNATGSFTVGRAKYNGNIGDFFGGSISNVQSWNYTLTPSQVTALYQQVP